MKYFILILMMSFIGCGSTRKILMRNCEPAGGNFFWCEQIPQKETRARNF